MVTTVYLSNILKILLEMADETYNLLPENVLARAAKATDAMIPKKSKACYDKEYADFEKWMETNSVKTINETVMLGYFQELSESYSPNSLWTKFSMLRKELMVKKKIKSCEKFVQLQGYLKQVQKGYRPKKSKVLTREQVVAFLTEAPDSQYLMHKVALLMGIFGTCRRDELVKMKFTDVRDVGTHIIVDIPVTKTDKGRSFLIIEESEMKALNLMRHYISLRPENVSNDRFFLCVRENRCTSQPVGKNTLGGIPCKIARYLGLPEPTGYTGHCLRRTGATLHSDAGGSMTNLMKLGGWKSQSVAREYIDDSHSSKEINASLVAGVRTSTYTEVNILEKNRSPKKLESVDTRKFMGQSGVALSGEFHNCSFYFNEKDNFNC